MSLEIRVKVLTSEIEELKKLQSKKKKQIKFYDNLTYKFNEHLKNLGNNYEVRKLSRIDDRWPPYFLNELVIISDFRALSEEIWNKEDIKIGDVLKIDELGHNGNVYFNVNGHRLNNHVDIIIDRLYRNVAFIQKS